MKILWDKPNDTPDAGKQLYDIMFPIAEATYIRAGEQSPGLPGRATVSGTGPADGRFSIDDA